LGDLVLWSLIKAPGGAALLSNRAGERCVRCFPKKSQGIVQSNLSARLIRGAHSRPTLGGCITDTPTARFFLSPAHWQSSSAFLVITTSRGSAAQQRVLGPMMACIALLVVGVGSLQFVLEEVNQRDWFPADVRDLRSYLRLRVDPVWWAVVRAQQTSCDSVSRAQELV